MSLGPWGFGVNRAEIQQLVRELVIIATKLPPEKVYCTDTAARGPKPPRGTAAIRLGDQVAVTRTFTDERIWPANQSWTVTVVSVVGNPQQISVLGVVYEYAAASSDVTATRDGLLAALLAGGETRFTATAQGTDAIAIVSTVPGLRLEVLAGFGNDISVIRDTANAFTREYPHYELQCDVDCSGLMDIESPQTTQGGQSMADLVEVVMSSRRMTERMRDCGHVPVRISRVPGFGPIDAQQHNSSVVQVIIATTGRLDTEVASVTAAFMRPVVSQ
jgi:hypothetical protein